MSKNYSENSVPGMVWANEIYSWFWINCELIFRSLFSFAAGFVPSNDKNNIFCGLIIYVNKSIYLPTWSIRSSAEKIFSHVNMSFWMIYERFKYKLSIFGRFYWGLFMIISVVRVGQRVVIKINNSSCSVIFFIFF